MISTRAPGLRRQSGHRSRQGSRGQALIFGLLFAAVAALLVLVLFNSALLTTTKSQLQNAADAGAYSAALLQARDANFSAYTNRAMIANQVAVAQFVSLKSYFDDAGETHSRIKSSIDSFYRGVFPTSAPVWDVAKRVPVDRARSTVDSLAPTSVKALDLLIDALMQAQQINHVGTMADMMLVADDVVKKNDPQARVTTSTFMLGDAVLKLKQWDASQKRFRANDSSKEADRFADAVVDENSTDAFVRNRWSFPAPFWASNVKFCVAAAWSATAYGFSHFGGTLLSSNKKRWLALDATQGGGAWMCTYFVPCWTGVCPVTIGSPLLDLGGSGGAVAGARGGYDDNKGYENNPGDTLNYGWALASLASIPALYRYTSTGPGTPLDSNGGLQTYYRDVASPLTAKPKNASANENGGKYPITLEVERTAATVRDTTKFMPGSTQLDLKPQMKGDTLRALASAHAFFYRPPLDNLARFTRNGWRRDDHKTEYQNLFSPYWQARLAPTTLAEEAAAAAGQ